MWILRDNIKTMTVSIHIRSTLALQHTRLSEVNKKTASKSIKAPLTL